MLTGEAYARAEAPGNGDRFPGQPASIGTDGWGVCGDGVAGAEVTPRSRIIDMIVLKSAAV